MWTILPGQSQRQRSGGPSQQQEDGIGSVRKRDATYFVRNRAVTLDPRPKTPLNWLSQSTGN